jgi:predicted dehydrogenase
VGTKGTLLWDGAAKFEASVVTGSEGFFRPLKAIEVAPPVDPNAMNGHASVIAEFIDSIEAGRAPETASSDNIKSLAMVFAAIESARTRQRVKIST